MATTFTGATRHNAFRFAPESLDTVQLGQNLRWDLGSDADLDSLATAIATNGQIQPVVVRKNSAGTPILVAGFRRFEAIRRINQDPEKYGASGPVSLLARVEHISEEEALEINLSENIDRKNLSPVDLAVIVRELSRRGKERKEIAEKMHVTVSYLSQLLGLFDLPQEVLNKVHTGALGLGAAVALRGLDDESIKTVVDTGIEQDSSKVAELARAAKRQTGKAAGRSLRELKEMLGVLTQSDNTRALVLLSWLSGDPNTTDENVMDALV